MHLWEETLEGKFVAYYLEKWWGLLIRRPQEEKGREFSLSIQFLEGKQHMGGDDCNVPNL